MSERRRGEPGCREWSRASSATDWRRRIARACSALLAVAVTTGAADGLRVLNLALTDRVENRQPGDRIMSGQDCDGTVAGPATEVRASAGEIFFWTEVANPDGGSHQLMHVYHRKGVRGRLRQSHRPLTDGEVKLLGAIGEGPGWRRVASVVLEVRPGVRRWRTWSSRTIHPEVDLGDWRVEVHARGRPDDPVVCAVRFRVVPDPPASSELSASGR